MDVVSALFADGDTVAGAAAAREGAAAPALAKPATPDDPALYPVCAAGLWYADRGDFTRAGAAAARLRAIVRPGGDRAPGGYTLLCATIIEAQTAAALRRPDALARLERLDSLTRVDPALTSWVLTPANLVVARLRESRGQLAQAVAAARRRSYIADLYEHRILVALPMLLRTEGRLAASLGDTVGAVRAYRHYLALRSDPEPSLRAQADGIRHDLAALTRP